jgi:hypothetical protein
VYGTFGNPESLAYGGDGLPRQPLYLVRFEQRTSGLAMPRPRRTRFWSTFTSTG